MNIVLSLSYNLLFMFIDQQTYKRGDKEYTRTLLRRWYREDGKVKLKTIANISSCSFSEIEAFKIALKQKNDLSSLKNIAGSTMENGKFVWPLCVIDQVAHTLGITQALWESEEAKQILWLICSRLLEQWSRLSATRMAKHYAIGEIFWVKGFCEDDLYKSMDWLYNKKDSIEKSLFRYKQKQTKQTPKLFLYDVSSSYFEGTENELAEYGYNRDKKKWKKQLVYGVLTDEDGDPVSIQAFKGNTQDTKTFSDQIQTLKERFWCTEVTLVGDKGMIKSAQIENLKKEDFHYITTISKSQIESLINKDVLQLELFQDTLCEVIIPEEGIRYVLRRNPTRAEELTKNCQEKINFIQKKVHLANTYLVDHPKAKIETQEKHLQSLINWRKLNSFIRLEKKERTFNLIIDEDKQKEVTKFDWCYVMKTDLTIEQSTKEIIHNRYKDLAKVEWEFRTQKTGYLEIRSIYLRKKERTIAHLFITMLAYKIEKYLREAWAIEDLTVEEWLRALSKITTVIMTINKEKIVRIPKADKDLQRLLDKAKVTLPPVLPHREAIVITRKKLIKNT